MDAQLTNLKCNRMDKNHWGDNRHKEEPNSRNQHNQSLHNDDRDLDIKMFIPEYDGKMLSIIFMDLVVCVDYRG